MKNILVFRPGAIGDTLLTFPVLNALRWSNAASCITLVGNAKVLPLAIASGVVKQAFDFQDVRWSELFSSHGIRTSSLRELVASNDLAICWMRDTDGLIEHNLKALGIQNIFLAPGRPPAGEHIHIIDYLAQTIGLPALTPQFVSIPVVARGYEGWPDVPLRVPTVPVYELPVDSMTISNFSNRETISASDVPSKPVVAIHPGSGAEEKCWPVARFAKIIKRLWKQNQPILLLSGPADTERVDGLLELLPPPPAPGMFNMLASAPLLEVAQYLQQCRCYLGNDSGITHLAAMLGVPTVAIFGPTDPHIWRPVGPSVKVIHKQTLEHVTVDDAIECLRI